MKPVISAPHLSSAPPSFESSDTSPGLDLVEQGQTTLPKFVAFDTPPDSRPPQNSWYPDTETSYTSLPSYSKVWTTSPHSGLVESAKSQLSSREAYIIPLPSLIYAGPERDDQLHSAGPRERPIGRAKLVADSSHIRGSAPFCNSRGLGTFATLVIMLAGLL